MNKVTAMCPTYALSACMVDKSLRGGVRKGMGVGTIWGLLPAGLLWPNRNGFH